MPRSVFDRLPDRLPDWAASISGGLFSLLVLWFIAVFGFRYPVAAAWQQSVPPGAPRVIQFVEALGITVVWLAFVVIMAVTAIQAFCDAYRKMRE